MIGSKFGSNKMFRLIIFSSFVLTIFLFSVGYAKLSTNFGIHGNVIVKKYTGMLRIVSVDLLNIDSNSEQLFKPTFYSTTGSFGIKMSNLNSSVSYKVTIINESSSDKRFKGVIEAVYDNLNIEYTISGLIAGEVLEPGSSAEVIVTFKYKSGLSMVPNNSQLGGVLLFNFSNDSFIKLTGTVDTVVADFSTGITYGTFNVEVNNPNDFNVNFSLVLGNSQLLLYDGDGNTERITDDIGPNETKKYTVFILERDNTISDSLTITTPLNIVTNSPDSTVTVITDMITIRLPNKAKYVVLDDNKIVTTPPVFSNLHTDSGLFKYEDGMEGGVIYFFRGNVNNNYVYFAGNYWRILQLDDYMNVRLILDSDIGTTSGWQGSEDISDLDDALYKIDYDNSLIKPIVDDWFNNNIANNQTYLNLIRESKFCIDLSYKAMTSSGSHNDVYYFGAYIRVGLDTGNYQPEFTCPTNYLRSYNVGIIGADEVSFAGGYFNTNNANFFLKSNNVSVDTWSISPSYYDSTLGAGMFLLGANGRLNDWTSSKTLTTERGIRPVITLDGSLIISGDGTYDKPYVFASSGD